MPIPSILTDSLKRLLLSSDRVVSATAIPILLYHSIDDSGMADSVSPEVFSKQMEYLHKEGYQVISLDEAVGYVRNRCDGMPSKTLAITFDDGYRSVYESALPVLQKYDFTASVFIPTQHVGRRSEWNDPSEPLLDWREILAMAEQGVSFGSHGHSHRDLTGLTAEHVQYELEVSKQILEDALQRPVSHIAYPFSRNNGLIDDLVLACGYRASFSVMDAQRRRQQDRPVVLRRSIMRKDNMLSFKFVLAGTYQYYFDVKRLVERPRRTHENAMASDASSCG
jgi:peptidoglycan/xylan/chitin deacetylase (PgdA/CDA1 family)